MDQLPRSNERFAANHQFADSQQQYNAHDNHFQAGPDPNSYDASWGINASTYPGQPRAQPPSASSWPHQANHLPTPSTHVNPNGQASPYSRLVSHSAAGYTQNSLNGFGAPQNFQYRQQSQYDPGLVTPHAFNPNFNYTAADYQIPNSRTIAPNALQHGAHSPPINRNPYDGSESTANIASQTRPIVPQTADTVDQAALASAIPKGQVSGRFSIINFDSLAKATTSERMTNFLNIGTDALHWDVNRAALPNFVPRKSRSQLRKSAGSDPKLLAKLSKKTLKKASTLTSLSKPVHSSTAIPTASLEKIKYEGESSSESESASSDDEESSYTSDDVIESSPLPAKRPDSPREATEYDTIKALWRGKRKTIDPDSIRKGLGEFWEIAKTIRDRWKADLTAFQDAESKDRKNELPLLQSRVKDQRDMMESAFKAALKHGHRSIVELSAENPSLLYLCYQFLLDRAKAEDFNSSLPRVMLETMTLFATLTDEKLEKTHLVKVIPRFIKKGDAKTQFYAKRIVANAAAASKGKTAATLENKAVPKETNVAPSTSKRAEPETKAGVKRPSTADEGGTQKKIATGVPKTNNNFVAPKQTGTVKKSTLSDGAKFTTGATVAVKPKQIVAKPSGLFSSLQSAAKKPGTSNASRTAQPGASTKAMEKTSSSSAVANQTAALKPTFSFAETMANLSKPKEEKAPAKQEKQAPPETVEEKSRRLRKEARRSLRVSFKSNDELVQVRLFHHDPDEELGHDANQVRDAGDVGGEGRMFKQQHQMMDIDDEDEAAEEEKLIGFVEPKPIDFSDIDPEERKRNYSPFGGGELEPQSRELPKREFYDANNLIVYYALPNDIPANPREPSDPNNGEKVDSVTNFGTPEDSKWAARVMEKKVNQAQMERGSKQAAMPNSPAQGFDLSRLTGFMNNPPYSQPTTSYPVAAVAAGAQPPAPSTDTLSSILASLKQSTQTQNQATPPPAAMGGYGPSYPNAPPSMSAYPAQQPAAQPNGQPDLAAILAQIQQNQPGIQQPPMSGFGYSSPNPSPNLTAYAPQMQQQPPMREGAGETNMARGARNNLGHNPYFKTKVCKYWLEGRCQKGDQCTYKHETE